ncbi:lysophospholipase [Hahella sp. CR1]|uniref:alpha/beta hydrolase n=1 Tax=Hahella sp. CR1 TaxID=2992807 RepID=UPI00244328BA|nr:alpha/beta fold hydrolase [Hahella sp. CR1]MDG9668823.1 lysophospholipase [Hahella sp. CR1]
MWALISTLLLICFSGAAFFWLYQDRMIFFPQAVDAGNRSRLKSIEFKFEHDGVTLSGWFQRGEISARKPLLLYFGGNGEEVSWNAWEMEKLPVESFLLMNYRGYGDSEGAPGEEALVGDAVALYDHLTRKLKIDPQHIVLLGRSLGSGVAVQLADRRPVRAVVLTTPFDSLAAVGKQHYPWLPVGLLVRHPFNSLVHAATIKAPALALLAGRDRVVPMEHGQRLMAAWGGPQRTVTLDRADHNDISMYPEYWRAISQFIESL